MQPFACVPCACELRACQPSAVDPCSGDSPGRGIRQPGGGFPRLATPPAIVNVSSAQSVTRPQLTVLRQQRGYLPELAPGGLLLRLDTRGQAMPAAEALSRRRQLLLDHLQIDPKPSQTGATAESRDGWISACLMAMDCVVAIQERLLLSVQESPRCRLLDQAGYLLFLPATPQSAASACQLLEHCLAAVFSDASATEVAGRWRAMAEVQEALRTSLPLTFNSLSTLRAARDLAIPSEVVAGSLCRYGWGARAVLMDGSLTQQTSAIGCNAAKNKLLAKILLRRAGLPVERVNPASVR